MSMMEVLAQMRDKEREKDGKLNVLSLISVVMTALFILSTKGGGKRDEK